MTTPRANAWRFLIPAAALLLMPATATHADIIPLTATLTGAQEVPPASTTGRGVASLVLDDVARTLITTVTFQDLASPTIAVAGTSAHIHLAPPGATGPIIHPFATAPIGVTGGSFVDTWTGLTDENIAALLAGDTYINIHTTAFPGGEIRGQITVIPEPSTLALCGPVALAGGLAGWRWRRHKAA